MRLCDEDKDYIRQITRLDIPNLLKGVVNSVQSTRVITVKDADERSFTVILDGVEPAQGSARKQLGQMLYRKEVDVFWYEQNADGWILGEVYLDGEHVNSSIATAAEYQGTADQDKFAVSRNKIKERHELRKQQAQVANEIAIQNWVASQYSNARSSGDIWVNGYNRKDGTHVRGHYRSR